MPTRPNTSVAPPSGVGNPSTGMELCALEAAVLEAGTYTVRAQVVITTVPFDATKRQQLQKDTTSLGNLPVPTARVAGQAYTPGAVLEITGVVLTGGERLRVIQVASDNPNEPRVHILLTARRTA